MIRDISDILNRNIVTILLFNLVLVIPISFFIFTAIQYFYVIDTVEMVNLIALFLIIINFTALFPPFFYLASRDLQDQPCHLIDMVKVFFRNFGYMSFITILFFMIGALGSFFLFIPTILSIMVIFLIPLFCDKHTILEAFKGIWRVVKKEHISILLDIFIVLSLNLLVWSGSLYLLANFENNSLVYITVRVLLNALFFPLIYFYLTIKYRDDLGEVYGK
ncbi:hypothetical protein [Bacillus tuaregi]|uniref:hypothetical protein n=1 Tax=Bacillus tuaregi TaxID=1816695 RepID=UPI0008F86793|nr:hypothetical protein [Bacillus tuaregi]